MGKIERGCSPAPDQLLPCTVPALQLEQLLKEAREKDEDFVIRSTHSFREQGNEALESHSSRAMSESRSLAGKGLQVSGIVSRSRRTRDYTQEDLPLTDYDVTVPS